MDGVRVVVLDERAGDSAIPVLPLVVGLQEYSAGILEDIRLNEDHSLQHRLAEPHHCSSLPISLLRHLILFPVRETQGRRGEDRLPRAGQFASVRAGSHTTTWESQDEP